jgi:hypothetical protein
LNARLKQVCARPPESVQRLPEVPQALRAHIYKRAAAVSRHGMGTATLSKCEKSLLTVFAQQDEPIDRKTCLIFADYRASGDTSTAFARFLSEGWIQDGNGLFTITESGLEALGEFTPRKTGAELREQLRNSTKFSSVERRLIGILIDEYPNAISRGDAVTKAGYKPSGDTSTALAKFVTMGYVVQEGKLLKASDKLYQ